MSSNVENILNAEIDVDRYEDGKHEDSYWYGDIVAFINTPSKDYRIAARGDVRCSLLAKKDYIDADGNKYKRGDEIAYVKDKNEAGRFMEEMSPFIKNDDELSKAISGEHPIFEMDIENNNWFSLEFLDSDGNFLDDCVLDCIRLDEAIEEAKQYIIDENKDNIIYGIYNRVANKENSSHALEMQKASCLNSLNYEIDKNTDVVKVYTDIAPSRKEIPSSLKILLQDMKDKKIKIAFTQSISRLSRDTEQLIKIQEILKESDSDIFIVDQNKFLYNDLFKNNPIIEQIKSLVDKNINKEDHDEIEYE